MSFIESISMGWSKETAFVISRRSFLTIIGVDKQENVE